jgi:hypothetical protein
MTASHYIKDEPYTYQIIVATEGEHPIQVWKISNITGRPEFLSAEDVPPHVQEKIDNLIITYYSK